MTQQMTAKKRRNAERIDRDRGNQVIHPLQSFLAELEAKHRGCRSGAVADYIPELSKANPEWFGICVATIDGEVYAVGDAEQEFTIQSISKPFVYGMALQDRGMDAVLAKISVEPSGDAFNSISLQRGSGRPFNPMINAGAIAATGLVNGSDSADRFERILDRFSRFAGRRLDIDQAVYESERDTGFRNFAIGYMLRNFGILEADPTPTLDLYFRQCSILVTCRDLAMMAATLASGGVSPVTGEVVLEGHLVPRVLSVMATCGMYDYTGEWIYRVGLPSKSGVGGGIMGVLPGNMGIAVFSPPLDERGNSVRGIRVFEDMSRDFGLHLLSSTQAVKSIVRSRYDASEISSKRLRRPDESNVLALEGKRIVIYELQGELTLFAVERVLRDVLALPADAEYLILDLRRVFGTQAPAVDLLLKCLADVRQAGREVMLAHPDSLREGAEALASRGGGLQVFADTDAAIEHCESAVLKRFLRDQPPKSHRLEDFEFCQGLSAAGLRAFQDYLTPRSFACGDEIIRQGDPADSLFFLLQGQVSVWIAVDQANRRRLTTCTPGMLFGEMAILERRPRSASVVADGDVECLELRIADFERLSADVPEVKVRLLESFARRLSTRVRRLTEEIRILNR